MGYEFQAWYIIVISKFNETFRHRLQITRNGYIRITRVRVDRQTLLMHVINSLGSHVDLPSVRAILSNLVQSGALSEEIARALLAAVSDKALNSVPREYRDVIRADIMKQVLILQV